MQELVNLRWYIQHLIDQSESDDDDDEIENPLSEENWMLQNNWKFIIYVIHIKHSMTPKQLKKKPIKQSIKIGHERLDTDEGESNKDEEESTTLSEENSILIHLLKLQKIQNQLKHLKFIMFPTNIHMKKMTHLTNM